MEKKFENIQFWRLISTSMVFMVHFGQRTGLTGFFRSISDFGAFGVHLFFMISGFLIVNSYENYGRNDLKKYYYKKLISILPLYYCVILYYFVVHTFILKDVPADPTGFGWLRYLLVLNNILPNTGIYFWDNLGITWTIPYFMFAYLVLPLVLKFVKNLNSCIIFWAITVVLSFNVHLFNGWFSLLGDFQFFVFGMLIYYIHTRKKEIPN